MVYSNASGLSTSTMLRLRFDCAQRGALASTALSAARLLRLRFGCAQRGALALAVAQHSALSASIKAKPSALRLWVFQGASPPETPCR